MNNFYQNYLKPHDAALEALEISVRGGARLEQDAGFDKLCELSAQIRDTGRQQSLAGNGASAAFANHMRSCSTFGWTSLWGLPSGTVMLSGICERMSFCFREGCGAPVWHYPEVIIRAN